LAVLLRKAHALTDKETIVLADFTNTTGDTVFDGTLRQALAVQLEQSQFLSLVSVKRIQQTLRMMVQPAGARLTPEIAQELCQRADSKAYIGGSIASLGSQYVLGVKAVNCRTGDSLAEEQERATGKEQVLSAMDKAAANLRKKLGESFSSIQKFDVPLTQVTTPSLEALKAYTLGREQVMRMDSLDAIPFFKRAIELDPNFASAYSGLGTTYANLLDNELAEEYTKKAFELRERASEREKLHIASRYYDEVTGELDRSLEVLEVWKQTYPRDYVPVNNIAYTYERMGELEKAAEGYRAVIALNPQPPAIPYQNLGRTLLWLDRREEAKSVMEEALGKNLGTINLHLWLYELAFEQKDAGAMERQVEWAAGRPEEYLMLVWRSSAALFEGKLQSARELVQRANELATRQKLKSRAAGVTASFAMQTALL
jgi:tetratricopeptide (TPR) repeat protein